MGASREYNEAMEIMKQHGAVLERTKKHQVWRFPDNRTFAMPSSPSCAHAWKNSLSDLRTFVGHVDPERGKVGTRRPRREPRNRQRVDVIGAASSVQIRDVRSQLANFKIEPPQPEPVPFQTPPVTYIPYAIIAAEKSPRVWWKPWTWRHK